MKKKTLSKTKKRTKRPPSSAYYAALNQLLISAENAASAAAVYEPYHGLDRYLLMKSAMKYLCHHCDETRKFLKHNASDGANNPKP